MSRFALVVALAGWAATAAAQPAIGPIQASAMHAAALVALDDKPPVPADAAWSRVQDLARGTDVTVTVESLGTLRRVVMAADAASLTIAHDLGDVTMTTVPREQVVEVRRNLRVGRPVAASVYFGFVGFFSGLALGGWLGNLAHCYDLNCFNYAVPVGFAGAVGGAALGHHFYSHDAEETIYHAP